MTKVTLEVNGKKVSKEVPDHTLLSVFLRDNLNLTGTHVGCDTSQCGACVVHVDGKSIKSWQTRSKTIFNLRILPFGGYVKMNGEEISEVSNNNDSYLSKKYYQKLLITLGGPIFNFILGLTMILFRDI